MKNKKESKIGFTAKILFGIRVIIGIIGLYLLIQILRKAKVYPKCGIALFVIFISTAVLSFFLIWLLSLIQNKIIQKKPKTSIEKINQRKKLQFDIIMYTGIVSILLFYFVIASIYEAEQSHPECKVLSEIAYILVVAVVLAGAVALLIKVSSKKQKEFL